MSKFKNGKLLLGVAVLGLCVLASQASAETIFMDDFQSDGGTLNGPSIGAGDIGGSWTNIETNTNQVQVCDDNPAYYVQLYDSGNPAQAWVVLDSGDAAKTQNQTVTLTSTIYNSTSAQDHSLQIAFVNAAPSEGFDYELFHINFEMNGTMNYYDPTSGANYFNSVSYTPDAWNNITVVLDMATKLFSVTVDGQGTDTGSWGSDIHQIQAVGYAGEAGGFVYMDNVQIDTTVPEPATMSLLAVGGLGMLLRKK